MKVKVSILKQGLVCGAVLALAFSCIKPAVSEGSGKGPGVIDGVRYGRLSIPSIDVMGDLTQKVHGQSSTRAVSSDGFNLCITSLKTGEQVHANTVAGFSDLDLPVGSYAVSIESHAHTTPEWDKVHYSVTETFDIAYGKTTTLDDLVCKVSGILVSVKFTDKMLKNLSGDYGVDIKIGNHALSYENGETRVGNFVAEVSDNTLIWDFYGTLDGVKTTESSFIMNVRAGEHRTLTFDANVKEEGYASFGLEVSVQCEAYDVNLNVEVEQPTIDDPGEDDDDGPVTITGSGIPGPLHITSAQAGDIPVVVNISAEKGIAGFTVDMTSTDAVFGDVAAAIGTLDLISPSEGALEIFDLLGIPYGDKVLGKPSLVFDITPFVDLIFDTATGSDFTVDFIIKVTDAEGNNGTKTVKLHLTTK